MNSSNLNIVEKLTLQVDSFQEGFQILSGSKSLEEIAEHFVVLLRGNFLVTKVNVYYKQSVEDKWKVLRGKKDYIPKQFDNFDYMKTQLSYDISSNTKILINLPLFDKSFIGITIGNRLDRSEFSEFDRIMLQIFLQLLNNAYQTFVNRKKEKGLIFELNEKVFQLNNLIDTGIELSKYENRDTLYEFAIEQASSLTNASSALIAIVDKSSGNTEIQLTFPAKTPAENILKSKFKIDSSFEYNNKFYQFVLSGKETRVGITTFNELDQLLLQAISKQVQASIENQYLYEQSLEKERMEKELNLAALIQQRVLPKELPQIEGYELAGINIPSREVGGDYYDCIVLPDGKYAFIIADVAGKGIAAALLVNTLNAALYSYMEFNLPLNEMADKLNKLIFESSPPDKFITFFIAVLDPKTGECDILNAGHNPILFLKKDGTLEQISASGIGLGMLDFGVQYVGEKLTIHSGDKLFLYTDGIPEAMNINEEEYSDDRMIKFFNKHSQSTADKFINALVNDVKDHVGEAYQSDDITAMILKKR